MSRRKALSLIMVLWLSAFGCAMKRGAAVVLPAAAEQGKPIIENPTLAIPNVHFRVLEGELNEYAQTTQRRLKIQMDVYRAKLGAELRFVGPDAQMRSLPCTVSDMGPPKGLHQRWECTPRVGPEGTYHLEVKAHSEHGSIMKRFAWSYEKNLLQMRLENKEEWGRDDALYVQLEGSEDAIWNQSELFVGENQQHRATRTACPRNLPAKLYSQCFRVSLSALPNLPHGKYVLSLTAKFIDKESRHRSYTRNFNVRINRKLWSLVSLTHWAPFAVTREGLLLSATRGADRTGMPLENFLVAINAEGEEVWKTKLADTTMSLLLGNHHGLDVALANCYHYRYRESKGFLAFNARTGEALFEAYIASQNDAFISNILQSGHDKDLVVLRQSSKEADRFLEVCRFIRPNASSPWEVRCGKPTIVPQTNVPQTKSIGWAVRTPEGARVFVGSLKHHWCVLEWKNKVEGKDNEAWSQGCVEQGPDAVGLGLTNVWIRSGARKLWVFYERENGSNGSSGLQSFELSAGSEVVANEFPEHVNRQSSLWLVDSNDELITNTWLNDGVKLQRFSATGELLSEREIRLDLSNGFLMEGGDLLLLNGSAGVLCLKPDFENCWAEVTGVKSNGVQVLIMQVLMRHSRFQTVHRYWNELKERLDTEKSTRYYGRLVGLLPLSPTRSVVVSGNARRVSGFLVDSPGLKKDAPWPVYGHDLCRSNNLSVPVDNCWDGPRL